MSLNALSTCLLNTSRDGGSVASLDILTTLSVNKFLLISNLNLPWHNRRPKRPIVLLLVTWEKRPTLTSLTTSFQAVVESDKLSAEPPLLQTKQPQFPQLLLVALVL